MQYQTYLVRNTPNFTGFKFQSLGPKGQIDIAVEFSEIGHSSIFNLAFGMLTFENEIDDLAVLNNNDRDTILATIASTVYTFFEVYPTSSVFFAGSTPPRTRLYRRVITIYQSELEQDFELQGIFNQEEFHREKFLAGRNYDAFMVKKKF